MADNNRDADNLYCVLIVAGGATEQHIDAICQPFRNITSQWFKIYAPTLPAVNPINAEDGFPLDCKNLCLDEEGIPTVETHHYLQYCLGDVFQRADVILFVADCRDPAALLLVPCLGYLLSTKTISQQALMVGIINEPGRFESLPQRLQFEQSRQLLHQYCDIVIINRAWQTLQGLQQCRRPLRDYCYQESQHIAAILKLLVEYFWGNSLIGMGFTKAEDGYQSEAVFANGKGRGINKMQQATEQSLTTIQQALPGISMLDDSITTVFIAIYGIDDMTELEIATQTAKSYFNPNVKIFANMLAEQITDENEVKIGMLVIKHQETSNPVFNNADTETSEVEIAH